MIQELGKASNPNENIGQYVEVANHENGAGMLKILRSNEMKTLDDGVKTSGPEWTYTVHTKGKKLHSRLYSGRKWR